MGRLKKLVKQDREEAEKPLDKEAIRKDTILKIKRAIETAYNIGVATPLSEKERKEWLKILGYLSNVLNALLKEAGDEVREEMDLVSLLEKIPKIAVKEEDIGTLSFEALLEAFKLTVKILKNENISYTMKLEWARLVPGLVNALLLYAQGSTPEPVDRGELV
ncbi:MAG: hypothetical protein QW334_00430 [Thermofilum sp.]